MIGTCAAAAFDFLKALPAPVRNALPGVDLLRTAGESLPFSAIGMGWVIPSLIGLCIGSMILAVQKKHSY